MGIDEVLDWLEKQGSRRYAEGLARYGIRTADRVIGVSVGTLQALAKKLGKDHELALALWETGCYEARLLAAFVDDPKRVTRRQMNAWTAAFRPDAVRLGEGGAVGEVTARVRQAHRLCPDGVPGAARQGCGRRDVSSLLAAHRERRAGRT
jgi:hypothetical protein